MRGGSPASRGPRPRLAPGDDVPTEAELAQRWSTSRGPIRNALAALRQEGLIETTRGRPARVRERRPQAVDVSIPFTRWAREIGAEPGARTQEISLRRADAEKAALLGIDVGEQVVERFISSASGRSRQGDAYVRPLGTA